MGKTSNAKIKQNRREDARQEYVDTCEVVDRLEADIDHAREELRLLLLTGRFMLLAKENARKRLAQITNEGIS